MGEAEAAAASERLHGLLLGELTVGAVLFEVASTALACAGSFDAAGVTLDYQGSLVHSAATDDRTEDLERLQQTLHEGPSWEARRTRSPVIVADVATDTDWPMFTAKAVEQGVAGVYSVPLAVGDLVLGALTLYARRARLERVDLRTIRELSTAAAVVVANAAAFEGMRALVGQLTEAIESRDVIGQAKGVLMARERIAPHEAFERLRRMSQTQNMKVRDVARQVVDSVGAEG